MKEEKLILTKEEIKRIRQRKDLELKPLQVCDCKEKKFLTKVQPIGAGMLELDIELKCTGCGRSFEGFVIKNDDALDYFYKKAAEAMGII